MRERGIEVQPNGLITAATVVLRSAGEARRLTQSTNAARSMCADTGGAWLDTALYDFVDAWRESLQAVDEDLRHLADFLRAAADGYVTTDAAQVPE